MHLVAIHTVGPDREALAGKLASALGITRYEAASRLRSPGSGPFIIGVFADPARAGAMDDSLRSAGFATVLLSDPEIAREAASPAAKKFQFHEEHFEISPAGDERTISIPYDRIILILRGTGITTSLLVETVTTRSFDLGRAVMTGGIVHSRNSKKKEEVATQERSAFFRLYAEGGAGAVFREDSLLYDSLGAALQPSRALNFAYLTAELRRRSVSALYDERLLTRPAQVALLGTTLSPEEHLGTATALLAKTLTLPNQ